MVAALLVEGSILSTSKQTGAYDYEIVLVARTVEALEEMLSMLLQKGKSIGLCINEEMTNYMIVTAEHRRKCLKN